MQAHGRRGPHVAARELIAYSRGTIGEARPFQFVREHPARRGSTFTLIKLKRAAGRPKDLEAIAELEALLEEGGG
jgi:hypothetical protein